MLPCHDVNIGSWNALTSYIDAKSVGRLYAAVPFSFSWVPKCKEVPQLLCC